jgi:hypothetical protein
MKFIYTSCKSKSLISIYVCVNVDIKHCDAHNPIVKFIYTLCKSKSLISIYVCVNVDIKQKMFKCKCRVV